MTTLPSHPCPLSRKDYLSCLSKSQSSHLPSSSSECFICKSPLYDPVVCAGSCQTKFCRKCATLRKMDDGGCPKGCSTPWIFQLTTLDPVPLQCPSNPQCKILKVEDIQHHLQTCWSLPEHVFEALFQKWVNHCRNFHILTLPLSPPVQAKCVLCCNSEQRVRQFCVTCREYYCIQCRPIVCSQSQPPLSRKYIISTSPLEFRERICDFCGVSPEFSCKSIYRDPLCDVVVCQLCYKKLPKVKPNSPYHLPSQCSNHHAIGYFPKPTRYKCSLCERDKKCFKKCDRCYEVYCLACKPVELNRGKCQLGHRFQSKIYKHKLFTSLRCSECASTIEPKEPYHLDPNCHISLCTSCYNLKEQTETKLRALQGYQNCVSSHQRALHSDRKKMMEQCLKCQRSMEVKYVCLECNSSGDKQEEAVYECFSCTLLSVKGECPMGHPLKEHHELNKICSVCSVVQAQGKFCEICEFSVCVKCSQRK